MPFSTIDPVTKVIAPSRKNWRHFAFHGLEILRTPCAGPVFEDALSVRGCVSELPRNQVVDRIDEYSDIYCAYLQGAAVGTLRVTRATQGRLDCQELYPPALFTTFRHQIGSSSALCILRGLPASLRLARLLLEAAWIDQLPRGYRLDIINTQERCVGYYQRLGYRLITNCDFEHPRRRTTTYAMVFPADPDSGSKMGYLFDRVDDPLTFKQLHAVIDLTVAKPRHSSGSHSSQAQAV